MFEFARNKLPLNNTKRVKKLEFVNCSFSGFNSQEISRYHWSFLLGKNIKLIDEKKIDTCFRKLVIINF